MATETLQRDWSLFAVDPTKIRGENGRLAHFLPGELRDLNRADDHCRLARATGQLSVVRSNAIDGAMASIKNPEITRVEFKDLANIILGGLVKEITNRNSVWDIKNPKAVISERAGLAFLPAIVSQLPGVTIGFVIQTRDEGNPTVCTTNTDKLGSFDDNDAVLFDPMLATGGSMLEMIQATIDRGVNPDRIITVSAFSTPQGIANILLSFPETQVVTTPLEAGLNGHGFIVGGHEPHSMVGDFGDRYFGEL